MVNRELAILTIGASTTALFYVSGKKVGGKDYRIVADFFKSYKQNFFQSIGITILLGVMWFSSVTYFMMGYVPLNEGLSLSIVVIILVAFEVTMLSIYMCALLAKYELKTITLIKNSFLFTHAYFKESIQAFGGGCHDVILLINSTGTYHSSTWDNCFNSKLFCKKFNYEVCKETGDFKRVKRRANIRFLKDQWMLVFFYLLLFS